MQHTKTQGKPKLNDTDYLRHLERTESSFEHKTNDTFAQTKNKIDLDVPQSDQSLRYTHGYIVGPKLSSSAQKICGL